MTGTSGALKGGRDFLLAPSILDADLLRLGEEIKRVEDDLDWIHIDVMDGHFVPNLSFGPGLVTSIRGEFPGSFIDVHIMVEPAERFVDMFAGASPDILTVQAESTKHIHRVLQSIRDAGVRPGIAINPGTPVSAIETVLHMADLVLVMTVNPGFGAQKFLPEAAAKLKELVRFRVVHSLDYLIEVDGGVNADNASLLVSTGCDVLVAGSAIFKQDDPASAASKIRDSVSGR
ncbi:MAG: ribulose-phosphate 3-epimerase [Synergistaceae bacterium]|jgi:ribulose-phosphate 3-epimerase|nr:ribulose-phosphate 3-epimerase [Synergistaceae bacterium]